MHKRRSRHVNRPFPRPVVPVPRRAATSPMFFYPGAYSCSDTYGLDCSMPRGPHPFIKFCLVLLCGMTLLSGCTGSFRQRPEDANLRYLADAEEMMPIPYTPRDDGRPLTAEELHAFKTVSDIDRHLSEEEARIVELHFKHYLHQMRGSFDVYLKRSSRFLPYVQQVFASRGIPDDIAYLFMVESGGNPVAQSHAGAAGLWQFMPGTGKIYGLQQDNWLDERRDPYKATVAAANYLKRLHREFCNWHLAIAAYNAGEGKIGRAVSGTGASDFFDLCRLDSQLEARARLKDETRDYVPRLIAVAKIMRNLDRLGLMQPTSDMAWKLAPMNVPPLTDLNTLAWQLGLSWEAFSAMNPAYLRAASPPQQTIAYVPPERLSEAVRWAASPQARIYAGWKEYTIRRGDTFGTLAKSNNVSVDAIKQANLLTALPRQGKVILIPGEKSEAMLAQNVTAVEPDAAALMASSGTALQRPFPLGGYETAPLQPRPRPRTIVASRSFFASPIEKHVASLPPLLARTEPPAKDLLLAGASAKAEKSKPESSRDKEKTEPQPAGKAPIIDTGKRPSPQPVVVEKQPLARQEVKAQAASARKVEKEAGREPVYYRVQTGDTMYSLAKKWGTDVAGIQAANKMDKSATTVKTGQRLVVPLSGKTAPVAVASTGKGARPEQKTAATNTPDKVTPKAAQPGTAASASRTAGALNPLTGGVDNERTAGGQPLRVAYESGSDEPFFSEHELILGSYVEGSYNGGRQGRQAPRAIPASRKGDNAPIGYVIPKDALDPPSDTKPQVFRNVFVRAGENLEDIARANGVSTRALREANGLGLREKLKVGQKILVPQS